MGLAFLPLYHALCLHVVAFRTLSVPVTSVILPKWNASAVLQAIPRRVHLRQPLLRVSTHGSAARYRITNLVLVPSAVHQLVGHPDFDRTDVSSVVSAGYGAARLPPTLRDKFLARFKGTGLGEGRYLPHRVQKWAAHIDHRVWHVRGCEFRLHL